MGLLETAVDPRTQSYLDAREATLAALAELETALDAAREGGGERAVTRHHARGKLLARERIELLVDRDSPLLELSPVAGWGTPTPVGAAVVTAIGVIEDRACVIVATDPTVRGGTTNAATLRKILRAQEIALQNRLPVVCLLESSGYEPAEHSEIFMLAGRVVAGFARLAAERIPTTGTFFGEIGSRSDKPIGDLTSLSGADLTSSFDYLIALAPRAGGRQLDHLAEDERDALRLTRQCVQRFPRGPRHRPGPVPPPLHDPEDLLAIPPTEPRELLGRILDGSEFDEVQPEYGGAVCAGWGTLHGHPVAVLANAIGAPGPAEAEKTTRLVKHAELSGTPLLFLRHGEQPAAGAETAITAAVADAAVPVLAVRVGSWHGPASVGSQARFRFAWPRADAALAAGPDGAGPAEPASALALSGQLDDDGVIDPRDTRTVLGFCLSVIQPEARR
ncbi:MAG TPA: carboxyl transferase domain-containing protein [Natronosporangium sp.]